MLSLSTGEWGEKYPIPNQHDSVVSFPLHPKYPSPYGIPAAVAQPAAAWGKDNLGCTGFCCRPTPPSSRLDIYYYILYIYIYYYIFIYYAVSGELR